MKMKLILTLVLALLTGGYLFVAAAGCKRQGADKTAHEVYYCTMHPQVTSDKPGKCPICHMDLVIRPAAPAAAAAPAGQRKVLYYRNPMNPEATSPVPMKDSMGMDYIAVYEATPASAQGSFYIDPQKQQLSGIRTGKVEKRRLAGTIETVGRVAYDADLYVTQEEYLQARKSGSQAFADAARRKLLLQGMGEAEIRLLEKQGKPEEGLYLPGTKDKTVWVYATVYEYQAALVKEGQLR
jgi:hypothetical protein